MSQPSRTAAPVSGMLPVGGVSKPAADVPWTDPSQRTPLIILGSLTLLLILAYLDTFAIVRSAWSDDALYSHGYIVPIFALALMWLRWQPFRPVPALERWLGLAALVIGLLVRLAGVYMTMSPLDQISFIPALFGLFLLVGGWQFIRWAWPSILFLVLMFPWPSVLERVILWRLQTLASICSTFVLQTLGVPAFRQGNLINISGMELFVADACSGLRMLTIFSALAFAMIFLIERPWWDKFMILLSAVPIALIVNIIRITVTGLLYWLVGSDNELVQKIGHDWAGYFMMPLAMGFLWAELQILERVTIPVDSAQFKPIGARAASIPAR